MAVVRIYYSKVVVVQKREQVCVRYGLSGTSGEDERFKQMKKETVELGRQLFKTVCRASAFDTRTIDILERRLGYAILIHIRVRGQR